MKKPVNRRDVLAAGGNAAMVAAVASLFPMAGCAKPDSAKDIYGGYSGNKDFKYIKTPATVFDFGMTPEQEAHAKALHKSIIVFDNLMECTFYPELLDNVKIGGGTGGNFSMGITDMFGWKPGSTFDPEEWWTWEALLADFENLKVIEKNFGDAMIVALSHADILKAKEIGKIGLMPGTQNTQFLGRDVYRMDAAYEKGLRIVQLTYNPTNFIGSGSLELPENRFGLSSLGERVVAKMNDLNMMVDTGHCSPETMIRAAEISEKPIAISHAGMYSKIPQFRSTTDKALRTVADRGGVVGVISTPGAIAGSDRCTVNDYLDNVEHAINIAGIDHVGFGSDYIIPATFEQILTAPSWDRETAASIGEFEVWPWSDGHVGWENNAGYPNMTRGLVQRGYSDEDIAKVMGGNWMRLIKDTIG